MSEQTIGLGNGADTTTQATPAVAPKTTRGTVTSDPKLVACIKITRALDALDDTARAFVLAYIAEKYNA